MRSQKKVGATLGFVFLSSVLFLAVLMTGGPEAQAEVLDLSFTYTAAETLELGNIGDTTTFESILENTGTDPDSYEVVMTVNSPTPPEWYVALCTGGVCHGNMADTVYVPAGEQDYIFVEVGPEDTPGEASVRITVTSRGNPALSDSITFHLVVRGGIPLTDRWGLLILISLIFASGLYLILRRLKPARAT
jgi:hypothetical protein